MSLAHERSPQPAEKLYGALGEAERERLTRKASRFGGELNFAFESFSPLGDFGFRSDSVVLIQRVLEYEQ